SSGALPPPRGPKPPPPPKPPRGGPRLPRCGPPGGGCLSPSGPPGNPPPRGPPKPEPALGLDCLSATAVVTNTLSPQTTGDDQPKPGTATFQRIFLSADHSSGIGAPPETPAMAGPRNCGQSASPAKADSPTMPMTTAIVQRINIPDS